jgi:hypothetical protein
MNPIRAAMSMQRRRNAAMPELAHSCQIGHAARVAMTRIVTTHSAPPLSITIAPSGRRRAAQQFLNTVWSIGPGRAQYDD